MGSTDIDTAKVELLLDALQDIVINLRTEGHALAGLLHQGHIPDRLEAAVCGALDKVTRARLSVDAIREDIRSEYGLIEGRQV